MKWLRQVPHDLKVVGANPTSVSVTAPQLHLGGVKHLGINCLSQENNTIYFQFGEL